MWGYSKDMHIYIYMHIPSAYAYVYAFVYAYVYVCIYTQYMYTQSVRFLKEVGIKLSGPEMSAKDAPSHWGPQ